MNLRADLDPTELREHALRDPANETLVSDALSRLATLAQRRAVDEPLLDLRAPEAMVAVARAALAALDEAQRRSPARASPLWLALSQGLRFSGADRLEEAAAAAKHALELDSASLAAWSELGIVHKWRGAWSEATSAYQRAYALAPDERRLALDTALCATAAAQGELALRCYRAMGLRAALSKGGMPWVEGLPHAELRVPTRPVVGPEAVVGAPARFEVLAVSPLSPCHGVVLTPTFGDGLVDSGDLVLWDSAPVSVRDDRASGEPIPCFALLARLHEGDEKRFRFVAIEDNAGDIAKLAAALPTGALLVEQKHVALGDAKSITYGKLIVGPKVDLRMVRHIFESHQKSQKAVYVAMPGLYEALGDTKMAGQAHQAWGGIERTAEKRTPG